MQVIDNKTKVLFIMHMPPPIHGAAMIGKYIHDSHYINSAFDCCYINPATAKSLEDIGHFNLSKIINTISLCKNVEQTIKEIKPDLVYFTANAAGMPFYKDWLVMNAIKRALKKSGKIVVHYHNKGVLNNQDRLFDNYLYKNFFQGIKVILLAKNLCQDIKKYVKSEDIYICPNGIPDCLTTMQSTSRFENKKQVFRILFLSNMMKEKGVIDLLKACKILKNRNVPFHCEFVGDWKDIDAPSFESVRDQYDLKNECVAHGARYGEEKEPFWQNADMFVFPTHYHNECFPLVLLEAMQHGKACISTIEAAIPEIIDNGRTGILVSKCAPLEIADAIQKLAEDRLLCRNMGIEGRKKYENIYSLSHFEKNFVNVISSISSGID